MLTLLASYQHEILGYRKAQFPDENFGGIIADEMGLGKTLTMLSGIYMGKKRGVNNTHRDVLKDPSKHQLRGTTATLVVVPSACESSRGTVISPS